MLCPSNPWKQVLWKDGPELTLLFKVFHFNAHSGTSCILSFISGCLTEQILRKKVALRSKGARQSIPTQIRTSQNGKVKCHLGRLGLVRCVVSSIATGDIWVSEELTPTLVHQIMPSRPSRCLRHGNVQCVPQCPVTPKQSHPIRVLVKTFHFIQAGKGRAKNWRLDSLWGRCICVICPLRRVWYDIKLPGWMRTLFALFGHMFIIRKEELRRKHRVGEHCLLCMLTINSKLQSASLNK